MGCLQADDDDAAPGTTNGGSAGATGVTDGADDMPDGGPEESEAEGEPPTDDDPDTTAGDDSSTTTTASGSTDSDTDGSTDTGSGGCVADTANVTADGSVTASSTFGDNEFPAALAVDVDAATSWFSAGPGPNAAPSVFSWTVDEPLCLSAVTLTGNGAHSNPDFHEGFGFGAVTIRAFLGRETVFGQEFPLDGSPDPSVTAALDGVLADRIELELVGHEDPICGGFSELVVTGGPS
ncbi:MAG: hypothetical protein JKY37_11360 [Nannocystaceae bacterium]|nr:hypothetical protein [Nannocystaceae bacterium]